MTEDQMVQAYVNHGWEANAARADIRAGGWQNKEWLSGGSSGGSSSSGTWQNRVDAENAAFEQLKPYYEKLLKIYNGNIALAKQRLDQDYERGLRVKSETTASSIADINRQKAEEDRRFQIALGDLDQSMNSRGLLNSGIRTTERQKAQTAENYTQGTYDKNIADLNKGLQYYTEQAKGDYRRGLEDNGLLAPSSGNNPTGTYVPPTFTGEKSPADLSTYVSPQDQYKTTLDQEQKTRAIEMGNSAVNTAASDWAKAIQAFNKLGGSA